VIIDNGLIPTFVRNVYGWMFREGLILVKDRQTGDNPPLVHDPIATTIRRLAWSCAAVVLIAVGLAGCDKCGDPAKLNAPWDSKSCHGEASEAR
jgi:hypothetical protein